uniref:(northern house mosquito) hypothetical protein n=1 Tax=Culex pipiens TaxID=7175 RepID=A0A8D8D6B7_CULPI
MLPNFQDHPRRPHVPKLGVRLSVRPAGASQGGKSFSDRLHYFVLSATKRTSIPPFFSFFIAFRVHHISFFSNSRSQNCLLPSTADAFCLLVATVVRYKIVREMYAYLIVKRHELYASAELLTGECHIARARTMPVDGQLFIWISSSRE